LNFRPTTFLLNNFDDALAPLSELRGRGYDGRYIEVVDQDGKWAPAKREGERRS
jgi:hypothetical protein